MPAMLTQRMSDLLAFIALHLERTGLTPTFDEMKDALGLQSKSGIHRLVEALVERGFIRRIPNRARAIEIVEGKFGPSQADDVLVRAVKALSVEQIEEILAEKKAALAA